MSFLAQLWIPIVVSAVLLFVMSSLIHMVFKWHNSDYHKLANEDAVRDAIRAGNPAPGMYVIPYCQEMKDFKTPEVQKKFVDGPVGFVTLRPNGPPTMGKALGLWFAFLLVVGVIAAYVSWKALGAASSFGSVARVVGALAFLAFAGGPLTRGIWMGQSASSVAKEVLDAVIYAAIMGATFGWLWPR